MKLAVVTMIALTMAGTASARQFRAFYFVQQWLGSYCDQRGTRCCYPAWGKPKQDFSVYGLWPYFSDGSFPYNCGDNSYDVKQLKPMEKDLQNAWPSMTCPQIGRKFWLHEWNKHGTCTKSMLGEIPYLKAAVKLKYKINILQALAKAGIRPNNNKFYSLKSIKKALTRAIGFHPWVNCNHNGQGKTQIWQVTFCVDKTGTRLINCPYIPRGRGSCANQILFPSF